MGQRTREVNGQLYVREGGQWRAATALEETQEDTSLLDAFGLGVAAMPAQTARMAHFVNPQRWMRGEPMPPMTGPEEAAEGVGSFHSGAVTAGGLAPDLALLPLGFYRAGAAAATRTAGRAATRTAGRAATRVQARITAAGRQAEARSAMGGDSVGAAAADTPQGRLNDIAARIVDEMTAGGEMTADQVRLLPIGRRLGFEELPGMRGRGDSAARLWMASYMSNPSVRFALQDTLDANLRIVETAALRAIGSPGTRWGTEAFAAARQRVGREFDAVRDSMPETVTLPQPIREGLERVRAIESELGALVDASGQISRDNLFALRSDLNLLASDLASVPGSRLKANRVGDLSTSLDDFIRSNLPEGMAERWQLAREQYLIQKLVEKPGVMLPDGSISWRSARTKLNSEMPDAFRQTLENARGNLSQATRDFMDAVDYANAFGDLVPNSGTATRGAIGKLGPIAWVQGQAMRHWLRRERDRLNPEPPLLPPHE